MGTKAPDATCGNRTGCGFTAESRSGARTLNVNGVMATGWIDLDHPNGGIVGFVCMPHGAARSPVVGQVLVIHGPIRIDGRKRNARCEFKVRSVGTCRVGRCADIAVFPTFFGDPLLAREVADSRAPRACARSKRAP